MEDELHSAIVGFFLIIFNIIMLYFSLGLSLPFLEA